MVTLTILNAFALQLGHDVRQAFVEGSDLFVDKTLQGSLKTVEECEFRLHSFSDLLNDSGVSPLILPSVFPPLFRSQFHINPNKGVRLVKLGRALLRWFVV